MLASIHAHLPSRRALIIGSVILAALAVVLFGLFDHAAAATSTTDAATSAPSGAPGAIQGIIRDWGKAIVIALAGIIMIPAIAKRDVGGIVVILLCVVIAAGLLFSTETFQNLIVGLWNKVAGGN